MRGNIGPVSLGAVRAADGSWRRPSEGGTIFSSRATSSPPASAASSTGEMQINFTDGRVAAAIPQAMERLSPACRTHTGRPQSVCRNRAAPPRDRRVDFSQYLFGGGGRIEVVPQENRGDNHQVRAKRNHGLDGKVQGIDLHDGVIALIRGIPLPAKGTRIGIHQQQSPRVDISVATMRRLLGSGNGKFLCQCILSFADISRHLEHSVRLRSVP